MNIGLAHPALGVLALLSFGLLSSIMAVAQKGEMPDPQMMRRRAG